MSKNANKYSVDRYNIYKYTTADRDYIFQNSALNKDGFPAIWPTKNYFGKQIILSFVDAYIVDKNNNKIDDEIANFDIFEEDCFDSSKEDALTKIKFIDALLTPGIFVKGGVYYKGQYFVNKMNKNKANFFMKSFFNSYFHLEDGELILKYFFDGAAGRINYWPMKKKDGGKVVFSAVNATICGKNEKVGEDAIKHNFDVNFNEHLDVTTKEGREKYDVIRSILSGDKKVEGFYYKGEILPSNLDTKFKLYLEKAFVKRNLRVEDRDVLLTDITKCKDGYPLFWPSFNKNGDEICISVVNAGGELVIDPKYSNFDIIVDPNFDISNEENSTKIDIVRALLSKNSKISGALYLDSVLIPGNCSDDEIFHRRDKIERALKIYLTGNSDFQEVSKKYTVEDREQILNISPLYYDYYPGNLIKVPSADLTYKQEPYFVKLDNVNITDENGLYKFDKSVYEVFATAEDFTNSPLFKEIVQGLFNPNNHVRGGLFYQGKNIANKKPSGSFLELIKSKYSESDIEAFSFASEHDIYHFEYDKKSKMPEVWPTKDKNGRNVLLSVVDSDVFFKVGRHTVKAVVNSNFDIYEGETFGLVGESGSGKTTISRAILKINKLTKGGIYFKGRLISKKLKKYRLSYVRKNIQMIFQDPAASLNERANVDYIVSEGLYNFKLFKSKEERQTKVVNMLGNVGLLPEHLSRYPHEFSGGQRQRIGIARALIVEPQLILADEPISALDVSIRAQVLNLLKKLQNQQNLTYLFIAHDLSIIRYISDRIAVMHQGYIVELGNAEEIYNNPLHPYTKSLLTAIPQPDPRSKDSRVRIPYNKGDLDYGTCYWKDFGNGHYVLVNETLDNEITDSLKK